VIQTKRTALSVPCTQPLASSRATRLIVGHSLRSVKTIYIYLVHTFHLDDTIRMTAPVSTSPRPALGSDPPRRAFGSFTKPVLSPSGPPSPATSGSTTPKGSTFLVPPAEPQRTRSSSSTSSEAVNAATRAQAWLSTWAPKGEGRGREFLSHTLSGVAGVASTVGHGINGVASNIGVQLGNENGRERVGMGSRPSSYTSPTSTSPTDGSALARADSWSPPIPTFSTSTPQLPMPTPTPPIPSPGGKKIAQPSNLSRLGSNSSSTFSPSSPANSTLSRPSMPHPTSTTFLPPTTPRSNSNSANLSVPQPHGPSHLNPQTRSTSHSQAQPSTSTSHSRTTSFGPLSPTLSRSSTTTAGPSTRNAGMPYKIGFQPAGVRNDRTLEYAEERRRRGEHREKEEGRLGRRWAKVGLFPFSLERSSAKNAPSSLTYTSTLLYRFLKVRQP